MHDDTSNRARRHRLLNVLPDTPVFVETRDLLLFDGTQVVEASEDGTQFALLSAADEMGVVRGSPTAQACGALRQMSAEILSLTDPSDADPKMWCGFDCEPATVLATQVGPWPRPAVHTRMLTTREVEALEIPEALAEEFGDVIEDDKEIMAAFDGGQPVAFCYIASESESLWDVSIDTLEGSRRRGFAQSAFLALAAHPATGSKRPVWGAADSNPASLQLALRLGFSPVDRLWVLTQR